MKKKYRRTPVHALNLKISNWKGRERRVKELLVERCKSDEPLRPRDLTRYNKQIEEIRKKIFYYEAKLRRTVKAKARREAMQQLPPKEKP